MPASLFLVLFCPCVARGLDGSIYCRSDETEWLHVLPVIFWTRPAFVHVQRKDREKSWMYVHITCNISFYIPHFRAQSTAESPAPPPAMPYLGMGCLDLFARGLGKQSGCSTQCLSCSRHRQAFCRSAWLLLPYNLSKLLQINLQVTVTIFYF